MINLCVRILFSFIVLTAPTIMAGAASGDWPEFRGPTGQGVAKDAKPPLHWSQTENVVWKTTIPGEGWSSPIVYQGSVYLTAATVNDSGNPASLRALRLDATKGQILWNYEVFAPKGAHPKNKKNSHASPTPIMEDGRLYVHFGHMGTACLDADGKVLWRQSTVTYDPMHGNAGSPILFEDKLIFNCDGLEAPFVTALDKTTGKVVWKAKRRLTEAKHKVSFCTPLLIDENGRKAIVSPGSGVVGAYNPDNGEELWRVYYGAGESIIPRPVYGHGIVFIGTGWFHSHVYAIRAGGSGNVTDTHLVWKAKKGAPNTPSMLLFGGNLYFVADKGIATCVDAVTGKQHWQEKIGGKYSASPIIADKRMYVTSEKGKTFVIKADTKFEILAESDLKERTFASPAASGRALFIRTESLLYRIEELQQTALISRPAATDIRTAPHSNSQ